MAKMEEAFADCDERSEKIMSSLKIHGDCSGSNYEASRKQIGTSAYGTYLRYQ